MKAHRAETTTAGARTGGSVFEVREAILNAAVSAMEKHGYAGTSVREVARRAGVSQGALQHHFPTKTALVESALLTLTAQLYEKAVQQSIALPVGGPERCSAVLDALWQMHNLPIAHVITELIVAARTDTELNRSVAGGVKNAHELTIAMTARILPELSDRSDFADWILACVATMRGLAVLASLDFGPRKVVDWPRTREILLEVVSDQWSTS